MKIHISGMAGGLSALLALTMSLPPEFRNIALLISLILLSLLTLVLLTNDRWRYIDRLMAPLLIISFALMILLFFNGLRFNVGTRSMVMQLFYFCNTLLLILAVRYVDPQTLLRSYANVSRLVFVVIFPLSLAGIDIMKNPNAIAMSICPYLLYSLHIKPRNQRSLWDFVWAAIALFASLIIEARLATVILLLAILTMWTPARQPIWKLVGVMSVAGAVWFNIYYAFNFDWVLNEVLTNRVLLWNYYADAIGPYIWTGVGPLSAEVSQGAAEAMRAFLQRGSNPQYGTQSMYVLYLYQTGIVGLVIILSLFAYALVRTRTLFWPVVIFLLAATSETISFGAPSIVGTPMTLLIILSVMRPATAFRYIEEEQEPYPALSPKKA